MRMGKKNGSRDSITASPAIQNAADRSEIDSESILAGEDVSVAKIRYLDKMAENVAVELIVGDGPARAIHPQADTASVCAPRPWPSCFQCARYARSRSYIVRR